MGTIPMKYVLPEPRKMSTYIQIEFALTESDELLQNSNDLLIRALAAQEALVAKRRANLYRDSAPELANTLDVIAAYWRSFSKDASTANG
jgi:hypothetical protein